MDTISFCRVCQSRDLTKFFELGEHPPANLLLKNPAEKEDFYPLSLSYCNNCGLVQLNETVEPEKLFSKYIWVTGTAKVTRDYSEKFYRELTERASRKKEGYVLDVGSNDGTFLLPFLRDGFKVLGVDPAENIVKLANESGVPTLCRFFGSEAAKEIVGQHGKAKMVFARNVLPHVANTRDFTEGLGMCLADDGVLAVEVHYGGDILAGLQYDSIYHEHLCYFTLKTLERLLTDFGLYVFDITESPISGGSIVVYAVKNNRGKSPKVGEYYSREAERGINELRIWQEFAARSYAHRDILKDILQKLADEGEIIIGYGASARSSTLLNFCGIDGRIIKAIADQNLLKQGLFTAGTHIPIEGPEALFLRSPNSQLPTPTVVVILAWNFAEEIMEVLRDKFEYKGKVLVPLPNKPRLYKL